MLSLLLAGVIVCGDSRDLVDYNAPPCTYDRQTRLCGCGNTLMWDLLPVGSTPVSLYIIERKFIYRWEKVGECPGGQRWWNFQSDRPLPIPEYVYEYRVWAQAADGTKSLTPSNVVKHVGVPLSCVDDVTFKKVACPF